MTQSELEGILAKHKKWLRGEPDGEQADLTWVNLTGANLTRADLTKANLTWANLTRADLTRANLAEANLTEAGLTRANLTGANLTKVDLTKANLTGADFAKANLDHSVWPLWCGSLKAYVDDRIAIQLLYHTLSVVANSPHVSEDVKKTLLSGSNISMANRFHRVNECGKLKINEAEKKRNET